MGDKIHNVEPIKIEGQTHVEESVYKEVGRKEKGKEWKHTKNHSL